MTTEDGGDGTTVVDRLVEYARNAAPDRADLASSLRHYYAHVDRADLEARRVEDLFGMAVDHFQLASNWEPGTIAIEVADPKIELDGWGSDHTIVRVVSEDMPFLVDSVSMELSRLGIGAVLLAIAVEARNRTRAAAQNIDLMPSRRVGRPAS